MYMYTASRLFCKCMDIDPYYIKLHIFLFFLCIKEHLDFLQDDCCSSVKNLQGGITLFYRTFGACHLGLCTTESATTCLKSQTHSRALKWSRRTFLPVHGILVNTRNSLSESSAPPLHRRPCSIPWCSNRNESCEHSSKAHSFSHV